VQVFEKATIVVDGVCARACPLGRATLVGSFIRETEFVYTIMENLD
jgi:hypothetical protein